VVRVIEAVAAIAMAATLVVPIIALVAASG
jgi:hypothetical protein